MTKMQKDTKTKKNRKKRFNEYYELALDGIKI